MNNGGSQSRVGHKISAPHTTRRRKARPVLESQEFGETVEELQSDRNEERITVLRGVEDNQILLHAATPGVTGTYDWAAQSITMYGTQETSGGRGERRAVGEESTRARLQYLSAAESGGRQPPIHHDVNNPLPLGPQYSSTVLGTAPTRRCRMRRDCRQTVTPQRRTCWDCRCHNSRHQ